MPGPDLCRHGDERLAITIVTAAAGPKDPMPPDELWRWLTPAERTRAPLALGWMLGRLIDFDPELIAALEELPAEISRPLRASMGLVRLARTSTSPASLSVLGIVGDDGARRAAATAVSAVMVVVTVLAAATSRTPFVWLQNWALEVHAAQLAARGEAA